MNGNSAWQIDQTFGKALALYQERRLAESDSCCHEVLEHAPDHPGALHLLALISGDVGNYALAIELYISSIKYNPLEPTCYANLSGAFVAQEQMMPAMRASMAAVTLAPELSSSFASIGLVFFKLEKYLESALAYRKAVLTQPDIDYLYCNLGTALMQHGEIFEARFLFVKSIVLNPARAESYFSHGISLRGEILPGKGLISTQRAVLIEPTHFKAWNNLGNFLQAAERLDEAVEAFSNSVRLSPDFIDANCNMSLAMLSRGDFAAGWRQYEWRLKSDQMTKVKIGENIPRWHGEMGNGRTIFIYAEQGFGDCMHFCRYIPMVAAKGWHVLFLVPDELLQLMKKLPGVGQVLACGDVLPEFDVYSPLLSLPLLFNTSHENMPEFSPYLFPDDVMVKKWRQKMQLESGDDFRVGLVWSGNPRHERIDFRVSDKRRSIPPDLLAPFFSCKNVRFFSLQKNGPPLPSNFPTIDLMPEVNDFSDTAAMIANLDLVVSVDTSTLHLAGGMGKATWMLDRFNCCWRWERGKEETGWYPSMRIFRQSEPGEWQDVVVRASKALNEEVRRIREEKSLLPPFSEGGIHGSPPLGKGGRGDFFHKK